MPKNLAKSHPWRADLLRDVTISIGFLTVKNMVTGAESRIESAPTTMLQTAGPRMFRKKGDAVAFVESYRRDHGADVVSDVYKSA